MKFEGFFKKNQIWENSNSTKIFPNKVFYSINQKKMRLRFDMMQKITGMRWFENNLLE